MPSARSMALRRNVKAARNSTSELNAAMPKSRAVMPPGVSGRIVALSPRIRRMLAIFEPMTLRGCLSDGDP